MNKLLVLCMALLASMPCIGMQKETVYPCCPQGFPSRKITKTAEEIVQNWGMGNFTDSLCNHADTQFCNDQDIKVKINTLLFKHLFLDAYVHRGKNPEPLLELQKKLSMQKIDLKSENTLLTQKDLLHRIIPYITWSGCRISFETNGLPYYLIKINNHRIHLGFDPCIHTVKELFYKIDDREENYTLAQDYEITQKFNLLISS